MRVAPYVFLLLAGCVVASLCRGNEPIRQGNGPPAPVATAEFVGAGSCSATACHGSIKEMNSPLSNVRRNEHTTWMSSDKHSRAYAVLFDHRSEVIESRLAGSGDTPLKASKDERCLACHTTPRPNPLSATAWLNSDGVGCESCHGAASNYLGPHTTSGWEELGPSAKSQLGFSNTKDLRARAETCTGCHVGDRSSNGLPVRDVNHDLIAAGHPRLNFEFSAYLENMPPHWDEKFGKVGGAGPESGPGGSAKDFAARAWAIGRLATIKAALSLLERRLPAIGNRVAAPAAALEPLPEQPSATGKAAAPWPEFSEYGCFSCHHDLRDQEWRRKPRPNAAAVGSFRWGTWILPGTEVLFASPAGGPANQRTSNALDRLMELMETRAAIPEIRSALVDSLKLIDNSLHAIEKQSFDVKTIEEVIDRLNDQRAWDAVTSWDEAAQRYLALVPLAQSFQALEPGRAAKHEALHKRLCELLERLEFPKSLDSPRGFEPGRFPSQGR